MATLQAKTRNEVSANNQAIFDQLKSKLGMVPNLYATFANSENALANYLALSSAKSSLSTKEKEIVNLAVSQANGCNYCLAVHSLLIQQNGISKEQALDIRLNEVNWDIRIKELTNVSHELVATKGHLSPASREAFFQAGFTAENLVDLIVQVGDKTITNYLYATADITIDFPAAPALEEAAA